MRRAAGSALLPSAIRLEMGSARFPQAPLNGAEMHSNFDFSARQVIWILNFAAELVLLVVLIGRDRMRRYPFFTACIALFALRLMAEELLAGRTAQLLYEEIILVLADMSVIMSLLVLVELARRAFAGAKRTSWMISTAGSLVVAGGVAMVVGPTLAWKDLVLSTIVGMLQLMQFLALKGEVLAAVLSVELALLMMLFGRRYKAGWRSHTQQIVIGLSAAAIALLSIQATVQFILKAAQAHHPAQVEAQRIFALFGKLANANRVVYIAVLLWWIVWLWRDEPGTQQTQAAETEMEPEVTQE